MWRLMGLSFLFLVVVWGGAAAYSLRPNVETAQPSVIPTQAALATATSGQLMESSSTSSPGTRPSATAREAARKTRADGAYASGGLGLIRDEWERRHGKPDDNGGDVLRYERGMYLVVFRNGRV